MLLIKAGANQSSGENQPAGRKKKKKKQTEGKTTRRSAASLTFMYFTFRHRHAIVIYLAVGCHVNPQKSASNPFQDRVCTYGGVYDLARAKNIPTAVSFHEILWTLITFSILCMTAADIFMGHGPGLCRLNMVSSESCALRKATSHEFTSSWEGRKKKTQHQQFQLLIQLKACSRSGEYRDYSCSLTSCREYYLPLKKP